MLRENNKGKRLKKPRLQEENMSAVGTRSLMYCPKRLGQSHCPIILVNPLIITKIVSILMPEMSAATRVEAEHIADGFQCILFPT